MNTRSTPTSGSGSSNPTPTGFCLAQGEHFLLCPYDPSHQITNDRYARHVIRCRLNHKSKMFKEGKKVGMSTCRYNYTHQVPTPELLAHQERCPDQHDLFRPMSWVQPEDVKKAEEEQAKSKAAAQARNLARAQGQAQVVVHSWGRGRGRALATQFPASLQIIPGGYATDSVPTDNSTAYSGVVSTSGPQNAAEAGKTAKPAPSGADKSDLVKALILSLNQKEPDTKK